MQLSTQKPVTLCLRTINLLLSLKGLSHEMDLAFDYMHGLSMIYNAKSVFLAVNPSLPCLKNVSGVAART